MKVNLCDCVLLSFGFVIILVAILAATGVVPDIETIKVEGRQLDTYLKVKQKYSPRVDNN
jgi:hypothetical protein